VLHISGGIAYVLSSFHAYLGDLWSIQLGGIPGVLGGPFCSRHCCSHVCRVFQKLIFSDFMSLACVSQLLSVVASGFLPFALGLL
jgi:hypothetical protein